MIQSPKLMLMFVWNPDGFQVVGAMPCHAKPKGEMFTAAGDMRNLLTDIGARGGERGETKLAVHSDNARPHPEK
jgi:hypothetical protein